MTEFSLPGVPKFNTYVCVYIYIHIYIYIYIYIYIWSQPFSPTSDYDRI